MGIEIKKRERERRMGKEGDVLRCVGSEKCV